jgi:hypothetical protein
MRSVLGTWRMRAAKLRSARAGRARFAMTGLAIVCAFVGMSSSGRVNAAIQGQPGYRLLGGDGGVFAFGSARFFGSAASDPTKCPTNPPLRSLPDGSCGALASTPDGGGYWILNRATGKIYRFGDAGAFGQPADQFAGVSPEFVPAFVAIVSTPTGLGYWVLALEASGAGTVMHFGDAAFFGDTQAFATQNHAGFNGIPVAVAAMPDGKGYWEVHSDGGVFAFGDAHFYGSMASTRLNQPVVGIASSADGKGYWLVGADGGVFAFGDAHFAGSITAQNLAVPVVGIARNPFGLGYWLAAADGAVYPLGGAPSLGSMSGKHLAQPVFAIASSGTPT